MAAQFTITTTNQAGQAFERTFAFTLKQFRHNGVVYTAEEAAAPENETLQRELVEMGSGVIRELSNVETTDTAPKPNTKTTKKK